MTEPVHAEQSSATAASGAGDAVPERAGSGLHCDHCGYDLAGRAFGETCPECGALIEPSRFRGGWRNHRARRQFVVGAWLLFAAAATGVLGAAWSMIVRLLDLERSAVGAISGMATICSLASLIWLVPAARRIGMV